MIHLHRPHPWHGIEPGDPAGFLNAYIEITPFSTIKYEVDKQNGYLRVDRPQLSNALPPCAYGFVPQTWCKADVARLAGVALGDGDPLDICVLSERVIDRADILLSCRVVGGLLMVDKGEADDKIIAVLKGDPVWGQATELDQIPAALLNRLRHYFVTYKFDPSSGEQPVEITAVYGRERALAVIAASQRDYAAGFPRA